MLDVCLTCGLIGDLEAHHVAGRHNHATLTVAVCLDCHSILSTWQRSAGIELDAAAHHGDLDATRALVVGAVHLVLLYAQRHANESWFPAPLAVLSARAMSKMLDSMGPTDRVGRWLPDPTVPPTEATPVRWPTRTETDRIVEMAHLARALSGILGEVAPLPIATLIDIAAHPDRFNDAIGRAAHEHAFAGTLLALVSRYIDLSTGIVKALLSSDDVGIGDTDVLTQFDGWFAAATQLLEHVWRVTGTSVDMAT